MENVHELMSGYAAYVDAADFGAAATSDVPGSTPLITTSSFPCGAAVSASVTETFNIGC